MHAAGRYSREWSSEVQVRHRPSAGIIVVSELGVATVMGSREEVTVIARNRKASHDYEIVDVLECGIVLLGSEVKSIRAHKISLDEAFVSIENDEVWLLKCDIAPYAYANIMNHEPRRKRKLLLHHREIQRLKKETEPKGMTLIPLDVHLRKGRIKVTIGIARGRKQYDKRQMIRERETAREIREAMKNRRLSR